MTTCRLLALVAAIVAVAAPAADRPITGRAVPKFAPLDGVLTEFMDTIGATAAAIAVSKNGHIIYSRGYGWSNLDETQPTQSDSTFRIASNTKPITAAIVRNLIRTKRLTADAPVFAYLGIEPFNGKLGDPRLADVTVQRLLEHKGGWDKNQTFDPTYRLGQIKREMSLTADPTPTNLIEYMLAQPLQSAPGEKRAYSNFGYLVLGRIIEKATGKKYNDIVQTMICRPLQISDIRLSATNPADRDAGEVAYPRESELDISLRDSLGGLAASAPSLCAFMHRYWMNGELRKPRESRSYFHTGSQPNSTTALMEQRRDGIDYAVLFNSRRNSHHAADTAKLRSAINEAIDAATGPADAPSRTRP